MVLVRRVKGAGQREGGAGQIDLKNPGEGFVQMLR
jgi:hypothetical protein